MIDATVSWRRGTGWGRSKSALPRHRRPGGHDARRPRPALCQRLLHGGRPAPTRPGNARRRLTDAEIVTLCVAQVLMGIPSDRPFLARGPPPARASVSRAAKPRRVAQAAGPAGRDDRVADRRVRGAKPRQPRRSVLLDSTPVECGRSLDTVRRSAAGRDRRLRLLAQPLALVLGHATAPGLRPRRHPTRRCPRRRRPARTRDRAQLLPRRSTAARRSSATRAMPATTSPRQSHGSAPRSSRPARKNEPARRSTSRRSGNASSRSSSPAKTYSPSNATAPAHPATSTRASPPDYSHSPPASASTTTSAAQAAQSPTTPPNPWHQSSSCSTRA